MQCFRPGWLLLAPMLLSIAACETAVSKTCPALVTYAQADMDKADDELDALPAGSMVRIMIADYGATRAEIRACRSDGQ